MNYYWWGSINKAATSTQLTFPTCMKYNPGKPVRITPKHFKLPNGPLEAWQIDFNNFLCLKDVHMF